MMTGTTPLSTPNPFFAISNNGFKYVTSLVSQRLATRPILNPPPPRPARATKLHTHTPSPQRPAAHVAGTITCSNELSHERGKCLFGLNLFISRIGNNSITAVLERDKGLNPIITAAPCSLCTE